MGTTPVMKIVDILKQSVTAFGEDKATRLASAVAFSAIFSIAPLFIVLVAVAGAVLGHHSSTLDGLLSSVRKSVGPAASDTLRSIISASFDKPRQGVIAQVIGWTTFIIGASNLFASLQDTLNAIWHVEETKGGWRQMVRMRLLSTGMILVVGALLIVTFALNAAIAFVLARGFSQIPLSRDPLLLSAIGQIVSFALVATIFTLIFKVLPDVKINWRHAWFGGAITALLFLVGQFGISLYFSKAGVTSAYGAAGSLLVALLWIYYSALIMIFGAEITKITATDPRLIAESRVRRLEDRPAGSDPRPEKAAAGVSAP